jgi:hypothetical protein
LERSERLFWGTLFPPSRRNRRFLCSSVSCIVQNPLGRLLKDGARALGGEAVVSAPHFFAPCTHYSTFRVAPSRVTKADI